MGYEGCGREVICHKKVQQSFPNHSLTPPPQNHKFLDALLSIITHARKVPFCLLNFIPDYQTVTELLLFCLFFGQFCNAVTAEFQRSTSFCWACACDHLFSKLCANKLVPNNIFTVIYGLNNLKSNYELL